MMDSTKFNTLAQNLLEQLLDAIEAADEAGEVDADLQGSVLTIEMDKGTLIVNKHEANQEIWLSSPLSGGLHFAWNEPNQCFTLKDGQTLNAMVTSELAKLANIEIAF